MTAARIVLWRHGRTEWNLDNRFQGQADIPLDSVGHRAGRGRGRPVLAAFAPVALYASDLSRAYQTATALADLTGLAIQTDKRLREIDVGSWEGLHGSEVRAQNPDLAERLWRGEDVRRSPTGESPSEVAERVAEALTEIAEAAAGRVAPSWSPPTAWPAGSAPASWSDCPSSLAADRRPVQLRLDQHRPAPLRRLLADRGVQRRRAAG